MRDGRRQATEPATETTMPHEDDKEAAGAIEPRIIFIIPGGEKRERDYFHFLEEEERKGRRTKVRVAFATEKKQGLNPPQISKMAEDFIRNGRFKPSNDDPSISIQPGDIIYLLQDMDEFEPQILKEMKSPIEQTQWIVSNPCFEIWLYYHKYSKTDKIIGALAQDVSKRSQWLKNKLHTLEKGGFNPCTLHTKMKNATANSLANYKVKANGLPDVFSTQMHIVAQTLLAAMGSEFDDMIARRKENASKFKEKYAAHKRAAR